MSKYQAQNPRAEREKALAEMRRREEAEAAQKRKKQNLIIIIVTIVLVVTLSVFLVVYFSTRTQNTVPDTSNETTNQESETRNAPQMADLDFSAVTLEQVTESAEPTDYVKMTIQGRGEVIIRLFPEVAPETVQNFKNLVSEHFYDGLTFHRIMDNFMAQGGDPKGDGTGDSGKTIKGEFTSNGFENNLSHVKGVISMARGNSANSASCQFFIMFSDTHKSTLDGNYAAFGYVCCGQDVIDNLQTVERTANARGEIAVPVEPVVIESITFVTINK